MASIEDPQRADPLLAPAATLQRFGLWSLATLALLPMGREGPVLQVGASVAWAVRRRFPALLPRLPAPDLLVLAAGAGLAGGFNTPLMAVVFVVEEFAGRFASPLLWPALVACAVAAAFSNLTGQPMFALGRLSTEVPELLQVLWAVPIGLLGGLLGALFGALLLGVTRRGVALLHRRPLLVGLAVGAVLSTFALLSGGASGGDGERLMQMLVKASSHDGAVAGAWGAAADSPWLPATSLLSDLALLLMRLLGPVLALGLGIPGGLIDPAFAFGAVLGRICAGLAGLADLGTALGMAAGLAGATQLPVATVLFALRLAADQQLLPGLVVAAVVAAYVSRLLLPQPIYHALRQITLPSTR